MVNIDGSKKIHFGQAGASDMTQHKDPERKQRYISRHQYHENWTKSGFKTAGFWSTHLLWNNSTIKDSINDINNNVEKLNVKMK